jgi:cell shape-determining protein MreC
MRNIKREIEEVKHFLQDQLQRMKQQYKQESSEEFRLELKECIQETEKLIGVRDEASI